MMQKLHWLCSSELFQKISDQLYKCHVTIVTKTLDLEALTIYFNDTLDKRTTFHIMRQRERKNPFNSAKLHQSLAMKPRGAEKEGGGATGNHRISTFAIQNDINLRYLKSDDIISILTDCLRSYKLPSLKKWKYSMVSGNKPTKFTLLENNVCFAPSLEYETTLKMM